MVMIPVASRDKGTVKPPLTNPLAKNTTPITKLPRPATPPVFGYNPKKPGTPGMPEASENGNRMQRNAAKLQRQEKMMSKLKASGGKIDRKQKDRFASAAKHRMSKG